MRKLGMIGLVAVLAVGAVLLLVRLVGPIVIQKVKASVEATHDDAKAFAKDHHAADCVEEAARRLRTGSGAANDFRTQTFVSQCLWVAPASPDLCASVPAAEGITMNTDWEKGECAKRGLSANERCPTLFIALRQHCRRIRSGSPSNP